MTGRDVHRREQAQAVFFSLIMVVSMMAIGGAAFAGSAAAQSSEITVDNLTDFENNVTGGGDAGPDDTIVVEEGSYDSDGISVDVENITIRAADGQNPQINLSNNNQFIINSDNVTVRGLSIDRPDDGNSILSAKGDSPTIEDNELDGGPLAVSGSGDITLRDNTLVGTNPADGHGIFLTSTAGDVIIEQNNLTEFEAPANEFADVLAISEIDSLNGETDLEAGALTVLADNTDINSTNLQAAKVTAINPDDAVQDAVDRASQDYTILVEPGNYEESVSISTSNVTLEGPVEGVAAISGDGSGNGVTVDANNITVRNLQIEEFSNGIRLTGSHSNIVFQNVDSVRNNARGMEIRNDADLNNLVLSGVNFSNNNGDGIRAATTSNINELTIRQSQFNNNLGVDNSGIEVYQSESSPGQFNDVTITDTEFKNNGQKGIYVEKLSNAVLANVTVDGVENDTNEWNAGIDINLKYDDYENITLRNSTITNVSEGNPSDPSAPAAVTIKARDDPSSYDDNPATLDNVTINRVTIADSSNGLRFGEVGVDYSGDPLGPTDVSLNNSHFENNTGYHLEDLSDSLGVETALDSSSNNEFTTAAAVQQADGNLATPTIWSTIQSAVDSAESDQTVFVGPGTYNESVIINTPNVTLESVVGANETTIAFDAESRNPTINIEASNVTVDGFTVERANGQGFSQAVAVRATDGVAVANNTLVEDGSTGEPTQSVLITDDSGDQTANTDTAVVNNDIYGFDHGVAISTQAEGGIKDALVESNTIQNGVIGVKFSDYDDTGESVNAQVIGNEIINNTHGIYIFDDSEGPATTNPSGVLAAGEIGITGNDIVNNSETSITHLGDGQLDARLNYFDDGISVSGNVTFDPVLTTSIDNIEADSSEEVRQYGSVLELDSDGEAVAIGFSAPPDATAGELFEETDIEGNAFTYENGEGYQSVDADDTFSAGDVLIVTNNGVDEDIVVPVDTSVGDTAAQPTSVEVENGWNLVATGAADNREDITAALDGTGSIVEDTELQAQPEQPGAPHVRFGAFEGTWIFVDGSGEIFTGYAEDQSPSEYFEEVLLTDETTGDEDDEEL